LQNLQKSIAPSKKDWFKKRLKIGEEKKGLKED